jgi:hypothetical protein
LADVMVGGNRHRLEDHQAASCDNASLVGIMRSRTVARVIGLRRCCVLSLPPPCPGLAVETACEAAWEAISWKALEKAFALCLRQP